MQQDHQNMLIALILSGAIIFGFQYYSSLTAPPPVPQQDRGGQQTVPGTPASRVDRPGSSEFDEKFLPRPGGTNRVRQPGQPALSAAQSNQRVVWQNDFVEASIRLRGARFDDLVLKQYRESLEPDSDSLRLLSPGGHVAPYFAEFGWLPVRQGSIKAPNSDSLWQIVEKRNDRIILRWQGPDGLSIDRTVLMDADYVIATTDRLRNDSNQPISLSPYGIVARQGIPEGQQFWILHEGFIGVLQDELHESDYDDVADESERFESTGGWLGITGKYWLVALLAKKDESVSASFRYFRETDRYQADFRGESVTIAPHSELSHTRRLFAGAKRLDDLEAQGERLNLPLFDRAVDFGWFYFLTQPMFRALSFLGGLLGNFGLAILTLTVGIRFCLFPLANRSYRSMAGMRRLQPEMLKLRERYGDDRGKLQKSMMELYKREKVDPFSGCLPILVQIPIFFSLYKVLFVTIEMRHAPFVLWIQDLSAPDSTTIWNLFGLIPWTPPDLMTVGFLGIGALPLAMGFSMYAQQKLNPQPPDPIQAKVFAMLPILFTFLLARFSTGLVLYWVWNNTLSIIQQYVIMRRAGVTVGWGTTKLN